MRHRRAALTLFVLAVLTTGCSANDEPAAATSSTAAPTTSAAAVTSEDTATSAPPASSAAGQVISVTVAGGKVNPAPAAIDVKLGSTITIEVTADVADEIHVHGYDKSLALEVGKPGQLRLTADVPGQFEVELESAHLLLFTLRVS